MSDIEFDSSSNSSSSFHVATEFLKLLLLYDFFIFPFIFFIRFDKATYLSLIFKFILSVRLSNIIYEDHMFYYF